MTVDNIALKSRHAELEKGIAKLKKDNRDIATLLCRDLKTMAKDKEWSSYGMKNDEKIRFMLANGKSQLSEIFSGDQAELLTWLLGKDNVKLFEKLLARLTNYSYQEDWYRRSFRTKKLTLFYLEGAYRLLINFFLATLTECSLETLFESLKQASKSKKEDHEKLAGNWGMLPDADLLAAHWLALALDEKDKTVREYIRQLIYENNSGVMVKPIIAACLMSHDVESYKMIGDLLAAAKLQEGLRQTVFEAADEGSLEGFRYILGFAIENNLDRFSSVVRSLGTWSGVNLAEAKPKAIRKAFEVSLAVIDAPKTAEKMLDSDDEIEILCALWGIGVNEVFDLNRAILKLAQSGQKYKRMAALHFLRQFYYYNPLPVDKAIMFEMFAENDLEVWASLIGQVSRQLAAELNARKMENRLKNWQSRIMSDKDDDDSDDDNDNYGYYRADRWSVNSGLFPKETRLSDAELRKIFDRLKELAESTPKKEEKFSTPAYSTDSAPRISADSFLGAMIDIALLRDGNNSENIDDLLALMPKMQANTRETFGRQLLTIKNPAHRPALITLFCDPHVYRNRIGKRFSNVDLTPQEYEEIENGLRLKSSELRKDIIQLLLKRTPEGLQESIERLLRAKEEQKRLAGLELINQADKLGEKNESLAAIVPMCRELARELAEQGKKRGGKKSAAEEILVGKITETSDPQTTKENGYGFCDPNAGLEFADPKKSSLNIRDFLIKGIEPCKKLFKELSDLIHKHRDYEYEGYRWSWRNEKESFILGTADGIYSLTSDEERKDRECWYETLNDYPLTDVWKDFFAKKKLSAESLIQLRFFTKIWGYGDDIDLNDIVDNPKPWLKEWYLEQCPYKDFFALEKFLEHVKYYHHASSLIDAFQQTTSPTGAEDIYEKLLGNFYYTLPKEKFTESCAKRFYGREEIMTPLQVAQGYLSSFLGGYKIATDSDDMFDRRFRFLYPFYKVSGYTFDALSPDDFEKAWTLKLVDDAELYRELLCRSGRDNLMKVVSHKPTAKKTEYPNFRRLLPPVIDRLLDIELKRGDMPTEVSELVSNIEYMEGLDLFVRILHALGKEPFTRGYVYGEKSRKDALCALLQNCHPKPGETIMAKTSPLKQFSEQRLLEAAMYAPQWIEIVQQHLGWKGLASACWYFHSHINETMTDEKEGIIARYSPITPQRLRDGAFDIEWFNDAWKTLGEKRFQLVYDAAKYITSGGNHRRAQIFADAVRGRLKLADVQKSVKEKRNKDNLLAFSLLPLKQGKAGEKDQLERYAFLQNFLKESKTFGQQRRESEKKLCDIAMENLARAAGHEDVNRFIWAMETERSKELAKYLMPKKIDDYELAVTIDAFGKPSIRTVKSDGGELKDVPTKLKKNAYVEELKDVVKTFRDQFRSVRENFERSMELESDFTAAELANLSQNPIIRPIIEKLVFQTGKSFGFYKDGSLVDIDAKNTKRKLKPTDRLTIAHPAHLFEAKLWQAFQKIVFEREIIQPFKQVFRELYLPNADEKKSKTVSRRYAGHQIQPRKTVALLRSRNWTIDSELGFQKVFYKLDVIVRLYCYADWFMPSEIEAPTIEQIEFIDRNTLKIVPLQKIPPVIFSEIMRDLDLVVSVAHVGGVDPEASLSTVELRAAILSETLRLMKLKNVSLKKSHAMIKGTLGDYSVHLGSGEVQMMAGGSLTILPVHSQHRGRLFLPFIDDDPKAAEILSKTVLLSEDEKIKDPTIIAAITKR